MQTLLYLRVSSNGQLDGYGLDIQEDACRAYAAQHGMTIVGEPIVDVVSGKTDAVDREGLLRALQLIEDGEANVLLAARLDRIARELTVQEAVLARVWRCDDCHVHTVDLGEVKQDDPDDPMRSFMRKVFGLVHELDRAMIVKRLRDGRARKARTGKAVGAYPYGWSKDGPVEEEQETRRIAEQWRERGMTLQRIADGLNRVHRRTRHGRPWTISGLHNVLSKPNAPFTVREAA